MPTEKRHMYETGTINVETGNVAVKQDINYYSANPQSATKSIVRMMEDMDRRFSQNQIYDGLAVSNGGTTVDVASGTVKVGGRWVTIDANNIDATGLTGDYNVIIHVSGVSETNSRDPSGGESVNLKLEASGSWVDNDWKLAIGSANITAGTVNSVQDRAKRQINATIIKPYGSSTQVSIYTGDKPIYREAIRFTSDQILPYNDIVSGFDITVINISGSSINISGDISGSSLNITGQSNVANVSGSAISAASYQIGGEILDITEFQNLVGLNQPLDTIQKPTFEGVILNKGLQLNGESISGTSVLINNVELQQLSNIGINTISNTQWTYLGVMDQSIRSDVSVKFLQIESTQVSPTAPLLIASTGTVANLSVNFLEGNPASYFTSLSIFNAHTGSANPHIDWTIDQGATNIDINNIQSGSATQYGIVKVSDNASGLLTGIATSELVANQLRINGVVNSEIYIPAASLFVANLGASVITRNDTYAIAVTGCNEVSDALIFYIPHSAAIGSDYGLKIGFWQTTGGNVTATARMIKRYISVTGSLVETTLDTETAVISDDLIFNYTFGFVGGTGLSGVGGTYLKLWFDTTSEIHIFNLGLQNLKDIMA